MAEGGTGVDFSCSVCFEEYKVPKMLPCGHTFCCQCVKKMVCTPRRSNSYLFCPTCRRKVSLPDSGKVEDFPTNFALANAIPNQRNSRKKQNVDPACQCPQHKITMKFYCESCKEQVCNDCLLKDHKPGKHIIATASDIAANLSSELHELKETLRHYKEEEKSLGGEINRGFGCYQQDKKRLEQIIQETVEMEHEKLKKAEENLLNELNQKVEGPEGTYADLQEQYSNLQALSNKMCAKCNDLNQHFQKLHLSHSTELANVSENIERLKVELESLKITCQSTQTKVGLNFTSTCPCTCQLGKLTKVSSKPTILQPTDQLTNITERLKKRQSKIWEKLSEAKEFF